MTCTLFVNNFWKENIYDITLEFIVYFDKQCVTIRKCPMPPQLMYDLNEMIFFCQLKEKYVNTSTKFLPWYCFRGTYMEMLLLDAYKFDDNSWKNLHFIDVVSCQCLHKIFAHPQEFCLCQRHMPLHLAIVLMIRSNRRQGAV